MRLLEDQGPLIIVSGQPRGGTSLMMRIMDVSHFKIHAKEIASYEDIATTQMSEETNDWVLGLDPWTAMKVFYVDVPNLPVARRYKILWLQRNAREQAKSQQRYSEETRAWMERRVKFIIKVNNMYPKFFASDKAPMIDLLRVRFEQLVTDPVTVGYQISAFLGREVDMSPVVVRSPKVSKTALGTLEMRPFKKELKEEFERDFARKLTEEEQALIDEM